MEKSDGNIPIKTSTIALYDILMSIKGSPVPHGDLYSAWANVLHAKANSVDFCHRYAEVMCLFADLRNEISDLQPERTRIRIEKYYQSWWIAMVHPLETWHDVQANKLISDADLDMLGTACDLIGTQRGILHTVSASSELDRLRAECDEWTSLVSDSSEFTDDSYRQAILAQIKHLIWLIDNANTFGIARVVQQGDQVTGALVRASVHSGSVTEPTRLRDRVTAFITALTLVANLIHSSQVVYDAADHALPGAERIIKEITSGNPEAPRFIES